MSEDADLVRRSVSETLRLHPRVAYQGLFAEPSARAALAAQLADLVAFEDIAERDRYPEFDVPDYEGLFADEAYESSVELKGTVERPRLVSEWRRQVEAVVADECVELVRASREFRSVGKPGVRPGGLGDLEAVSWCPPCESDYPDWTVDVWYLTEFDGLLGKGYSFMVDPRQHRVAMAREFVVRAAPATG